MDAKNLDSSIETIAKNLNNIFQDREQILTLQRGLEQQGIEYGAVFYRDGKYMLVIRPVVNGSKRVTVYIGTDPIKQQDAYDSLERGDLHTELSKYLVKLDSSIADLEYRIKALIRETGYVASAAKEALRQKKKGPTRAEKRQLELAEQEALEYESHSAESLSYRKQMNR